MRVGAGYWRRPVARWRGQYVASGVDHGGYGDDPPPARRGRRPPPSHADPTDGIHTRQSAAMMALAVLAAPRSAKDLEVVLLRYVAHDSDGQMGYREIGKRMAVTAGRAQQRHERAIQDIQITAARVGLGPDDFGRALTWRDAHSGGPGVRLHPFSRGTL